MRDLLKLFSGFKESGRFYLTGGTALSEFYLHHRISLDLDLFLPSRLSVKSPRGILDFSRVLSEAIKSRGYGIEWHQKHAQCGEMGVDKSGERTRVTLAFDTAPLLYPPVKKYLGVRIASFEDAAAGKLAAFMERMEHRDIVDMYYILKKIKVVRLVALSKKRWPHLDAYQVAKQFEKVDGILPSLDALKGFLYNRKLSRGKIIRLYETESVKLLKHVLSS